MLISIIEIIKLLKFLNTLPIEIGLTIFYQFSFADAFKNLYDKEESDLIRAHFDSDILESVGLDINCYHFSRTNENELETIQERVKNEIFRDETLKVTSKHVRNVAPNKEMHVTMFKVNFKNLFTSEQEAAEKLLRQKLIQNAEKEGIKKKLSDEGNGTENGETPQKIAKNDEN